MTEHFVKSNNTSAEQMSSDMQLRFTRLLRLIALLTAAVAAFAACSGDDPVSNRPGLHIVAGGSGTDTIEARLAQPVVVELRDDNGSPLANREVRLFPFSLTVSGAGITSINSTVFRGTTDADGRVQANVQLGQALGDARLDVVTYTNVETGALLRDSALFTVTPGRPALVTLAPRDTALYPAARLLLRQTFRDRFRNLTTGSTAAVFTSTGGVTAASSGIVTPRIPGRDTIIARVGAFADTILVTTLPITGVIAAQLPFSDPLKTGLAVMNLDGSNYKEYAKGLSPALPRFTYDNLSIVTSLLSQNETRMWVVPIDGSAPRRLVTSTTTNTEGSVGPSPDGLWIYYCAIPNGQNYGSLYRVRPNGTGMERMPDPTPVFSNDFICTTPSISADGKWMAWYLPGDGRMKTRDVQTGARTALNREGYTPQFAPTGTRIAYIKGNPGPLYTADLDGSNDRLVATGLLNGPLSWSPDGKYIFVHVGEFFGSAPAHYELIEEATGKRFPLPNNIGPNAVLRPK